jgi:uncharacterized protein (TIGR02118 family)
MPTKITVIYDNPTDPEAFEAAYVGLVDLARQLPGLASLETSKVWPKEDGTPTPAYRMVDMYFPDYDTASAAVTTAEAGRSSRWEPAACGSCSPTSKRPDLPGRSRSASSQVAGGLNSG